MNVPERVEFPFFAYGIFRPGQIGYCQLKEFVSRIDSGCEVAGELRLRDGLPIVDRERPSSVIGVVLHFANLKAAGEAYSRISALEPDKQYRWGEALVGGATVNILYGLKPQKGSVLCEEKVWDGWSDPLFTSALEVVDETMRNNETSEWDLKPLFRLQMAYLLLWSAIERYASLRYHLGDNVNDKVMQIAKEPGFKIGLAEAVTERRELHRADRPDDKVVLDPTNPRRALEYYYQLRSNITHRGKGVHRDHDRILSSLRELLQVFQGVLLAAKGEARVADNNPPSLP